ncbi:GNAT family N-acetyltransferase [Phenylobacterium sp.]|jgi:GNAT superfamily N-acetyltransferase|uniref:GNAT family N-acetyltransferase n=1 Tax=Phenylobacterium sp. TaxID=1871053 RepID=UPI0037C5F87B
MGLELCLATKVDHPAIIALTNRAYRQAEGQAAWKVETIVGGQRLDEGLLAEDLAQPGANLLIGRDAVGAHLGHVRLDEGADGVWFLAMLTVAPDRQDGGLGRAILEAAETWVRARGGAAIRMTVIRQREELIAWYGRRGYAPTGETKSFPYGDKRFGEPTRDDLVFEVLEKRL